MVTVGEARSVLRRFIGIGLLVGVFSSLFINPANATPEPGSHISVLVPIVADAGNGGLIGAEELTSKTSTDGDWALLVGIARSRHLTLAVDTRIIASITALGGAAPAEVTSWLELVRAQDPLYLAWGNADPFILASQDSLSTIDAEKMSGWAGLTATDLVSWPTGTEIGPDSVARAQMAGFSKLIVSSAQFPGISAINSEESQRLATAIAGSLSAKEAAHEIRNELSSGDVIALPRNSSSYSATRAVAILSALFDGTFQATPLAPALSGAIGESTSAAVHSDAVTDLGDAFSSNSSLAATVAGHPGDFLVGRAREVASLTNLASEPDFASRVGSFSSDSTWMSSLISISLGSSYTVLSNNADIPVSVSNSSDSEVTVVVTVRATSGIVQVSSSRQVITIEPQSNVRISVPMTAVTNGRTNLVASLTTEDSTPIGDPIVLPLEVQAQWELLTIIIFVGGVATIMTIGIGRTLRRRRAAA